MVLAFQSRIVINGMAIPASSVPISLIKRCAGAVRRAVGKGNIMTGVRRIELLVVVIFALGCGPSLRAQSLPDDLEPISPADIPPSVCDYVSMQFFDSWPALPWNWLDDPADVTLYVSP